MRIRERESVGRLICVERSEECRQAGEEVVTSVTGAEAETKSRQSPTRRPHRDILINYQSSDISHLSGGSVQTWVTTPRPCPGACWWGRGRGEIQEVQEVQEEPHMDPS